MNGDVHGDPLRLLWAKTKGGGDERHALLYHMIDSGQVALALWEHAFTDGLRARLAGALALTEEEAGRVFACWIALHDVGKASPAFQRQCPAVAARLHEAGLLFPASGDFSPEPHGLVSTWVLAEVLRASALTKAQAADLARALGGHHGVLPTRSRTLSPHRAANLGGAAWEAARHGLTALVWQVFSPPPVRSFPDGERERNSFLALFAGWASVADWIASIAERFWCADGARPLSDYVEYARKQARLALRELGWVGWRPVGETPDFRQVFPFAPNPVQQAVIAAARTAELPALAIIEAPTGSGKTETALYAADKWLQRALGRGLYVAMPTQATSNQMFGRVVEALAKLHPGSLLNVQLVHGHALHSDAVADISLAAVDEDTTARVAALEWFFPRKRSLLAPFGVGTVDQSFLSVMQTKHFFVRLFGLARKVVVFDEVHAYDVYMNEVFLRLLNWLHAAGTSVIVLSATLPSRTRRELARAYGGCAPDGEEPAFPRLTLVAGGRTTTLPLPPAGSRTLRLLRLDATPDAIVAYLRPRLAGGGCAAVICNTVGRAQELYQHVREAALVQPDDCLLFHARFPFAWRQEKERQVLGRFGKSGERRERAIVVATQVIEQSLDLDFDYMVSDLCPVDLLIQRAGRLWRHDRSARPAKEPELALLGPGRTSAGDPDFGPSAHIYEPYYLLRTLACLEDKESLVLPAESAALVEAVYDEAEPTGGAGPLAALIAQARERMERERRASVASARARLVLPPEDEDFLTGENAALEEDAPQVHEALRALTREAPEGVTLICLHRLPTGALGGDPARPGEPLDPWARPTPEAARQLLALGVQIQRPDLVAYYGKQPPPEAWREHPTLRHCRLAIFEDGVCRPEGQRFALLLDRELGLRVAKEV